MPLTQPLPPAHFTITKGSCDAGPSAGIAVRSSSFVHHKGSGSNIARTVWPRITQIYPDIHIDLLHSHTWYDHPNYLQSEVVANKLSKMPPLMASSGISWERFEWLPRNFTYFSGTIGLTKLPDMTSLAASCWLQTAIKYCTKNAKNGSTKSNNSATVSCNVESPNVVCSRTGYDVVSYFRSALIEIRKSSPRLTPQTALDRILAARRCACPTSW